MSTNHNNNHSNDKRLFIDEPVIAKSNNKEDGTKANDEKHHRSRRKPKAPVEPPKASAPVAPLKQVQHKHTNGLNNNNNNITNSSSTNNSGSDKVLGNCINLLNGGLDAYDDEQLEKWKQENGDIRSSVYKEIRKLGRDYSGLFKQLEKVKGTFEMRFSFIEMCISEARRFRRSHMVTSIQEWWELRCDEVKCVELSGKIKT